MSLTEIMSSAGLTRYPEIALLLFVFAFLVILVRVFMPSRKRGFDRAARMPLDDDTVPPTPPRE
jgi:cbb3-type cytochrome oxidase subunit 3